ncbi:MAG: cell division protein ZapA [Oscillospiraceae bacterium]|nr:cell division protein ZapA [Oscillospiraceae bacterium]
MKNKVVVNISGSPYTILADESEEYVQKVSSYLDSKVTDIISGSRIASLDAMVLAGLNVADDYFKSLELNDSLRSQLKSCLDELSQAKTKLAELMKANDTLSSQIRSCQEELSQAKVKFAEQKRDTAHNGKNF